MKKIKPVPTKKTGNRRMKKKALPMKKATKNNKKKKPENSVDEEDTELNGLDDEEVGEKVGNKAEPKKKEIEEKEAQAKKNANKAQPGTQATTKKTAGASPVSGSPVKRKQNDEPDGNLAKRDQREHTLRDSNGTFKCHHFDKPSGCKHGDNCRFSHDAELATCHKCGERGHLGDDCEGKGASSSTPKSASAEKKVTKKSEKKPSKG